MAWNHLELICLDSAMSDKRKREVVHLPHIPLTTEKALCLFLLSTFFCEILASLSQLFNGSFFQLESQKQNLSLLCKKYFSKPYSPTQNHAQILMQN